MEQNNKTKTYFAIIVFIIIILLSGYVVVEKILDNKKNNNKVEEITKDYISEIKEISLNNTVVKNLYSIISDDEIEYNLYLDKNKSLSWDSKSFIVAYDLKKDELNNTSLDVLNIDREPFEEAYGKIFGAFLNNDVKSSKKCPITTFNITEDIYSIDLSCYYKHDNNKEYKTFLKNITLNDSEDILINKYYVFVVKDEADNSYSLYKDQDIIDKNKIIDKIKYEEVNKYMYSMNTLSYVFKKGDNGYYLYLVK